MWSTEAKIAMIALIAACVQLVVCMWKKWWRGDGTRRQCTFEEHICPCQRRQQASDLVIPYYATYSMEARVPAGMLVYPAQYAPQLATAAESIPSRYSGVHRRSISSVGS